jgi:hypothetical protein
MDPVDESQGDEEKLEWDPATSPEWLQTVNAWPWQTLGNNDWTKSGKCLRCGHQMQVEQVTVILSTIEEDELDTDLLVRAEEGPFRVLTDEGHKFYARCNCGGEHPARPAGITAGCGQAGLIDPPPDDE